MKSAILGGAVALATLFVGCGDKISCDSSKTKELLEKNILQSPGLAMLLALSGEKVENVQVDLSNFQTITITDDKAQCKVEAQIYLKTKPQDKRKDVISYEVLKGKDGLEVVLIENQNK